MVTFLSQVARDLSRLAVPFGCGGCGAVDVLVCPSCSARLDEVPSRVEHAAPRLDRMTGEPVWPVWSVTAYTGEVRDLVVAWKDRGRTDLDRPLCTAVAGLALAVIHDLLEGAEHGRPVLLVPAPSTAAARRRRGREPVTVLARAAARAVGRQDVRVARVLEHRRWLRAGALDQVGLGSRARGGNLAGAVRVRRAAPRLVGAACVLVDDVLTTGATLVECERAIVAAGGRVVGALVLAATPAPTSYPPGALPVNIS